MYKRQAHYDRKILDLQRRYDEQYDTIEDIEVQIGELQGQIRSIQQEKISGNNIYRLLLAFDEVYHSATEAEQKEFMKAFICLLYTSLALLSCFFTFLIIPCKCEEIYIIR